MTVLALDVGDRRIGIAVSDPTELLARPLSVVTRKSNVLDAEQILRVATQHSVRTIVVGLPLAGDDRIDEQARRSLAFARYLRRRSEMPVVMWDERFSTAEADRRMLEVGIKRSRRHAMIDAAAAAVILDEWLAAQQSTPATSSDPVGKDRWPEPL